MCMCILCVLTVCVCMCGCVFACLRVCVCVCMCVYMCGGGPSEVKGREVLEVRGKLEIEHIAFPISLTGCWESIQSLGIV